MGRALPAWVNLGLLPLINLTLALLVSGLIVIMLGENPVLAVQHLVYGAFGTGGGFFAVGSGGHIGAGG